MTVTRATAMAMAPAPAIVIVISAANAMQAILVQPVTPMTAWATASIRAYASETPQQIQSAARNWHPIFFHIIYATYL